jgi:cystathionine beta-lyase/cystathionine gamma-synthase
VAEDIRVLNGVTDSLVRLSAGIEDPQDLLADLEQALTYAETG